MSGRGRGSGLGGRGRGRGLGLGRGSVEGTTAEVASSAAARLSETLRAQVPLATRRTCRSTPHHCSPDITGQCQTLRQRFLRTTRSGRSALCAACPRRSRPDCSFIGLQDISFCSARPAQTSARLVVVSGAEPHQLVVPQSSATARPAVPARDATPWSAEEDELLAQLCSRKGRNDASAPAFETVAEKTGRSLNAVKVRVYAYARDLHACVCC